MLCPVPCEDYNPHFANQLTNLTHNLVPPRADGIGNRLGFVFLREMRAAVDNDRAVIREHLLPTLHKARLISLIRVTECEQQRQLVVRQQTLFHVHQVFMRIQNGCQDGMMVSASAFFLRRADICPPFRVGQLAMRQSAHGIALQEIEVDDQRSEKPRAHHFEKACN